MKTLKFKSSLQLMAITLLFASCTNLKQSNFNRQKYLHLKQQETSFTFKADKVEEVNVVENNLATIYSSDTPNETAADIPTNINVVPNESNLANASHSFNKNSTIENSSKTIEVDLKIENDKLKLNDTLFYKNGRAKPCIIHSWDDSFVTCSYPVRDVIKEHRISINSLDCFVGYDSLNQFQYESEQCTPAHSRKNLLEEEISAREKNTLTKLLVVSIMLIICATLVGIFMDDIF